MHNLLNKLDTSRSKRKKIVFALMIGVLLFSLSVFTIANTGEAVAPLGISEGNLATIEEDGSLEQGDLKLVLGLPDRVDQVKMTDPRGETAEKEPQRLLLGSSASTDETLATEDGIGFFSIFLNEEDKSIGLGYSSETEELDSAITLGSSGEEPTKQVVFDASVTGIYTFDFFDAKGTFLKQQTYLVGAGLFPDVLTLELIAGTTPINNRVGTTEAILDYTPKLMGEKEILTIVLPPFFTLNSAVPEDGADYTVTKATVPLPAEFYSDADSAILKTRPASETNCDALVFTFSETASNPISVSFTFHGLDNTKRLHLGRAMLAYGADPDMIPLRLVAKGVSSDGTKLVSAKSVNATSKMPDATGDNTTGNHEVLPVVKATPGSVSAVNWKFNYRFTSPNYLVGGGTGSTTGGSALQAGAWHYPVSNLQFYTPIEDGLINRVTNHGETEINGKNYIITTNAVDEYIRPSSSFGKNFDYNYKPEAKQSEMKTGDNYSISDMYMSYTYRGVDYGPVVVATSGAAVLPNYQEVIGAGYNANTHLPNMPNRTDRLQDSTDRLYFHLSMSVSDKINPTYKDYVYTINFPWEISPTHLFSMSTGKDIETRGTLPSRIEYYVYDDPTVRTMTVGAFSGNTELRKATFDGLLATEHVKQVVFYYDQIDPASRFEYYFDTQNSATDQLGNRLPLIYTPAPITTTISADQIKQADTPEAESVPYALSPSVQYRLFRFEKEDSLFFGSRTGSIAHVANHFGATTDEHWFMGGSQFIFRRTTMEMKDYEDVKVYITPKTPEDNKFLSIVNGLGVRRSFGDKQISSKSDVYYKTTLNSQWTLAEYEGMNSSYGLNKFELAAGEFVTEIMLDIGTIYGEKLNYAPQNGGDNATNGTVSASTSPFGEVKNINFWLTMNKSSREFYSGTPQAEPIPEKVKYYITAHAEVNGSTARHINEADKEAGQFFNNDPSVSIEFKMKNNVNVARDTNLNSLTLGVGPTNTTGVNPYQGSAIRYSFSNNITNIEGTTAAKYDYKTRFYFEVYNYVEFSSLSGSTLVETRPISANTTLYVFERTFSVSNSGTMYLSGRIRPDAPVNTLMPVFKATGTAMADFAEDYMREVDGVAYDSRSPYYTYNMQQRVLPLEWGITAPNLHQFSTAASSNINVQVHTEDSIDLQMYVDGVLRGKVGDFQAHNKEKLVASASMGNVRNSVIPQYEALFKLPRIGAQIPTLPDQGVPQFKENDYDLFLREPIGEYATLKNFKVIYYTDYAGTNPITINEGSPPSDLQQVKAIYIYFEDFAAKSSAVVDIPLRTDKEKVGGDFSIINAYIGAESRKDGSGDYSIHEARPFRYDSYRITLRVGTDNNENGSIYTNLAHIAKVTAYYKDGLNSVELYTNSANSIHAFDANDDIEKIVVESRDGTKYKLTQPNTVGVSEANDSDYPTDTGTLYIDKDQLYAGTLNLYDASFIPIPKVVVGPITLLTSQTVPFYPGVITVATGSRPISLARYTKEIILEPTPQNMVNVNFTQNGLGNITINTTGLKRGVLNYTYKITSPFGDVYSDSSTITVNPNYVPTATIKKEMDATTSSKLLGGGDAFAFELWEKDELGNKVYATNVSGVNTIGKPIVDDTALTKALVRGGTHFIREISKDGYELVAFKLSVDGVVSTIPQNADGDYEFTLPVTANKVLITAVNKNSSTDLTLQKQITVGSLIKKPLQQFQIKVTDQLNNVVYDGSLAEDETAALLGMIYGRTYTVVETPTAGFEVSSMSVEKAGVIVGSQPTAGNSYSFELGLTQTGSTVIVKNMYPTGNGITLRKSLDTYDLPGEDFTFVLTNDDDTVTYYGKVASDEVTFPTPATVTWYATTNHTGAEINVNMLPVGTYTVEETSTNQDFTFKDFTVISGNGTIASAGKKVEFIVTKTSPVVVADTNNRVKTTGRVEINKTFNRNDFNDIFTFHLKHIPTGTVYVSTGAYNGSNYDPVKGIVLDKWTTGGDPTNRNGSLPLGQYELTELASVHYELDGFTSTKTLQSDPVLGNKKVAFTLTTQSQGADNEIVIGAQNNLKKGQITLIKSISTSLGANVTKEFEFELYRWNDAEHSAQLVDANGAAAGKTVQITMDSSNLAGESLTLSGNYEYGRYFIVEKEDPAGEFSLKSAPVSTVIAEGTAMSATNAITLEGATVSFKAENRLNSAPIDFMVYKKVADANLVGVNTFRFELHNTDSNRLVFTGEVESNTAGIGTSAPIRWTHVAGDGTVVAPSGTAIAGLPYGNYAVKEVDTGIEFKPKDISASGFGTKVSNVEYKFKIDKTTAILTDFHVLFENQIREEATFAVSKSFVANENPFPGTVFEFELYNTNNAHTFVGTTDGSAPIIQWTDKTNGKVYAYNEMPYGTYELTEMASGNFTFNRFVVDGSSTAGITPTPNGKKLTIVSNGTGKVTKVVAENAPKSGGVITLSKLFEGGVNPFATSTMKVDLYGPEMNGQMPTPPRLTADITSSNNWSNVVSNLPYGTYKVVENLSTTPVYEFVSITDGTNTVIADDGTPKVMEIVIGEEMGQKQSHSLTILNRVANKGNLYITKEVEGENAFANLEYTFVITDIYGVQQEVVVKAGEKKALTNLPLGGVTIQETTSANLDWLGYEVNSGTRSTNNPLHIDLHTPDQFEEVVSFSKVKTDGTLTLHLELMKDVVDINETLGFQLFRSMDGGSTWELSPSRSYNMVNLGDGEEHFYSGLLRGAQYKIVAVRDVRSPYQVRDIRLLNDTVGTVLLPEETVQFHPMDVAKDASVKFILDIKRTDLIIDKFEENYPGYKLEKAIFTLSRYSTDGTAQLKSLATQVTDINGQIIFVGLPTGEYVIREQRAPRGYRVLQSEHKVIISNDDATGQLLIALTSNKNIGELTGQTLHIPNRRNQRISSDGSDIPDGNPNALAGAEKLEVEGTTNVEGETNLLLPGTGGISLGVVAWIGLALLILGVVLQIKKRRDEQKK